MKTKLLVASVLGLVSTQTFASSNCKNVITTPLLAKKEGGGVANGGDGFEGEFCYYANELEEWVKRNRLGNLNLPKEVNAESATESLLEKFDNVTLKFTDEKILINGQERTCENIPAQSLIHCNRARWKFEDATVHYITVFHEYLGLAGLEENSGGSVYPIASQLPPFFEERTVVRLSDKPKEQEIRFVACVENEIVDGRIFRYKQKTTDVFFFPNGKGYLLETVTGWLHDEKVKGVGVYSHVPMKNSGPRIEKAYGFVFPNKDKPDSTLDFNVSIAFPKIPKTKKNWIGLDLIVGKKRDGTVYGRLDFYAGKTQKTFMDHKKYRIDCHQEKTTPDGMESFIEDLSQKALATEQK